MRARFAGEAAEKRALASDPPGPSGEGRTGRARPLQSTWASWRCADTCVSNDVETRTRPPTVGGGSLQCRGKPAPPARGFWKRDCSFALLPFLEEQGESFSCAFAYILLANFFIQLSETNIFKKCRKRQERPTWKAEVGWHFQVDSGARASAVFSCRERASLRPGPDRARLPYSSCT